MAVNDVVPAAVVPWGPPPTPPTVAPPLFVAVYVAGDAYDIYMYDGEMAYLPLDLRLTSDQFSQFWVGGVFNLPYDPEGDD